jgi:hypothetical protein
VPSQTEPAIQTIIGSILLSVKSTSSAGDFLKSLMNCIILSIKHQPNLLKIVQGNNERI